MKIIRFLLLILMALQATQSFAYEPEIGHKAIVTTALKVYSQCFESQSFYQSQNAQKRVLQGDLSMDLGLEYNLKDRLSLKGERVFSKLIRPFNWHFYNPQRAAFSKVGAVEQSHIRLWDDLIEGFDKNKEEYSGKPGWPFHTFPLVTLALMNDLVRCCDRIAVPVRHCWPKIIPGFGV